ncbi:MAG: hypothetical protein PVI30_15225 [Myxococcales bacterium]
MSQAEPGETLAAFVASHRDALGRSCEQRQVVHHGGLRYIACGMAGLWIVRLQPDGRYQLVEARDMGGSADGFFADDGHLWVRVTRLEARPIDRFEARALPRAPAAAGSRPATQPQPAPSTPASPPPVEPLEVERPPDHVSALRRGAVIESRAGHVVVGLGADQGVRYGQRVELFRVANEMLGGVEAPQRKRLAVGRVDALTATTARVQLGLGEQVPVGAKAEVTGDPVTASQIAPPRVSELWETAFLVRPFAVLDNLGAGLFLDGSLGYRTRDNLHLEVLLQPLAIGTADDGATAAWALFGTASYDAPLFSVGLGVGGQSVNSPEFGLRVGSGITVVQRARLGARDGLNLEAFTHVVLFHSEFEFSDVRITGQIPMGRGAWLRLSGGGGMMGIGYGELGLRVLLEGNGADDSVFLTTTIGGVGLFEDEEVCDTGAFGGCEFNSLDYAGPMVGIGVEWRK